MIAKLGYLALFTLTVLWVWWLASQLVMVLGVMQ